MSRQPDLVAIPDDPCNAFLPKSPLEARADMRSSLWSEEEVEARMNERATKHLELLVAAMRAE